MTSNKLTARYLCELSKIDTFTYYKYLQNKQNRENRNFQDEKDFNLIYQSFIYKGIPKGTRQIKLTIIQLYDVIMNQKKIKRLMNKFNLQHFYLSKKPYINFLKNDFIHSNFDNIVGRVFRRSLREIILTDITYLHFNNGRDVCYLVTFKDAYTNEILGFKVSMNLKVEFVMKALEIMMSVHKASLNKPRVLIHSDQGSHYTSNRYKDFIFDIENLVQSMSRRGNCLDNSSQESFFGILKKEISRTLLMIRSYDIVERLVTNYINYYNDERPQINLAMLSPTQFYKYKTTGLYPFKSVLDIPIEELIK